MGEREGFVFTCHGRLRLPRLSWSATCMGATAAQSVLGSRGRGGKRRVCIYLPWSVKVAQVELVSYVYGCYCSTVCAG